MRNFKISFICTIMVSTLWLTGCASTTNNAEQTELQRSAMLRWNACLERHANVNNFPSVEVSKLMRQNCEGYKRDVIALFPPNLSHQVDQMLVSSAYRYIESIDKSNAEPAQMGELLQTVLR